MMDNEKNDKATAWHKLAENNAKIAVLQAKLDQIATVCRDNAAPPCDKGMALDFVRQVAESPFSCDWCALSQEEREPWRKDADRMIETVIFSEVAETCAKVAENYVPGPSGHPYEPIKHDICLGIANKLRALYLAPKDNT